MILACRRPAAVALAIALIFSSGAAPAGEPAGAGTAYRVAKVLTMDARDTVINNAVVLVKDGLIEAVGKASDLEVPAGYAVVERPGWWLTPGLIDCHNHTAGSLRDLNDMVYLTNPGLRTVDTIVPESEIVKDGRAGGVTTVLLIPGSGTNLSGFGTICKMGGETIDDVVLRSPGSLKIAQAGNPERYWYHVDRAFMNYNTRQTLEKAKRYHDAWTAYEKDPASAARPEYDPIFHDFRGLFTREFPVSVHTQMYQVMLTTIDMLTTKFGLWTILDHCTFDGWKIAPLVRETDAFAITGPRQYHVDRTQRKMHGNAARWWQGGVRTVGTNTDAPVVPEEELTYQAAMACWYGWRPYEALRGMTRTAAAALGLSDSIGAIEAGKEADLTLWTGNPIDPRTSCEMAVIKGKVVYDAAQERRF